MVTTRNATAQLTLFNPFPADAAVDVEVAVDTGVRVPTGLSGIVVPAGSTKVVDLGQNVQRRDQFSATVKLRSGRAIAELSQTFDGSANDDGSTGPRGIRLQLGVPQPRSHWVMASGFTGTGSTETVVVYNPNPRQVQASVQVMPYGNTADLPEPIELQVPALRYSVVDLSTETRVPPEGYHAIRVDSDGSTPVVAARAINITAAPSAPTDPAVPTRPPLTLGSTIGTGSSVAAIHWLVSSLEFGPKYAPAVFVHNPGPDDATVTLSLIYGGSLTPMADSSQIKVAKGASVVFQGPTFTGFDGTAGLDVTATGPVVVERLVAFPTQSDLSLGLAIPVLGERSGLVPVGGR